MNKLGQEIIEAITTEAYETIMFDYLANNCVDLKDEDIKKIVDLKCKQFIDILKEKQQLKKQLQQRYNIINKAREYIKDNADVYTNIMGKEVGFFKRHDDGWTPIELLEILNIDKGDE